MVEGLTTKAVHERQMVDGCNVLPAPQHPLLTLLMRQFRGVFNILLFAAAFVTYILGETIDAGFILLFVFLSVGLSFFQEYKSNKAAEKLSSYLIRTITVRRDGCEQEVSIHDLVVGDVLVLEPGDIVPADAIVRHTTGIRVDETTFTGESIPVTKVATEISSSPEEHTLLQGTVILSGTAYAEVIAVGGNTRLAHLAAKASLIQNESELTKGVDRINVFILRATVITLLLVVVANIVIDGKDADIPTLLIFAIALAVSVIPEALPLVMTFSLSRGALLLAKQHVIVKRLSSVQDLGSIELLCTDKTGTITENKLTYTNDYIVPEAPYHPLILARLTAFDLHERNPEPFDRAVDEALTDENRSIIATFTTLEEEAFDPKVRSNGALVERNDGVTVHIRRGSPEYFFTQGLADPTVAGTWLNDEETKGHRILGVSYDMGDGPRFGGFLSFTDVLKPSTRSTVRAAQELNVALTVITGDSRKVAEAVGRDIGLVEHDTQVMEASAFFALPVSKQHEIVRDVRVFARTTPEQKLSLIELLKEQCTVGFLGEGINDAPALKAAHVSMVVQSASDIARETADIILLRRDLHVIIDGIRHGRVTHANTLKYIRTTLVSNFGNFYALAIGSLFITFLPMLPKQLLLLNLLSDFPMMAIAFDRVGKREIARPQRYDFRSLYIIFITLGLVSTIFDFMYFGLFYRISPDVLQTNWFIASAITEILLIVSIRSMLPIERAGLPAPGILVLSGIAFVLVILLPIIPVTARFFSFTPPSTYHLITIVSVALLYLATTEIVKRPLARFLGMSKR